MRRVLAVLTVLLMSSVLASTAFAQVAIEDESGPVNTITLDPLPLALNGTISIEYERAIHDMFSVYGGPSVNLGLGDIDVSDSTSTDSSYFAIGLSAGLRFFAFGDAPEGLFLAPHFSIGYASVSTTDSSGVEAEGSGVIFVAGAMLGYTLLIADVFDISLGLGAGYYSLQVGAEATDGSNTSSAEVGFAGVGPIGRLALGVAF